MVSDAIDREVSARRFLRNGRTDGVSLSELAAACDRLVRLETQQSAPRAIRMGERFAAMARPHGSVMLLPALRALGWAYVVAGRYPKAEVAYREARGLARDPLVRARIDRILVDVFMYLGRIAEASRRARAAMGTFRRHGAAADLAKTEVNYANVLHRMDRHPEARDMYHRAGEFFKAQGDDLAAATCWYNEANTLVQLFDFDSAERLYVESREIYTRHDHVLRAVGCLYGLAWLHMLGGRFHIALHELAECEEHYRRAGQQREYLLCVLDRAETYLGLNLLPDARDAARRAERQAVRLGLRYEAGKASFFLGKAQLALGQAQAGHVALQRAAERFHRDGNEGFLTAVRVAQALAEKVGVDRVKALVAVRRSMPVGQLPLWEALCDLELMAVSTDQEDARKRLATSRAAGVMPHLRAQYLTLLGDRAAGRGQNGRAVDHWRRAADILTAVRAELPPIDIRAAFSEHHSDPYEKLIAAQAETDPRQAAAWLERYQTAGIWALRDQALDQPARARAEQSLADLALHVAAIAERVGHDPVRQMATAWRPKPSQRRLEERLRNDLAGLTGTIGKSRERLEAVSDQIARASQAGPIVQYHFRRDSIVGFVHEQGRSRSCALTGAGASLDRLLQRWRFFVERAPYRSERETKADLADERRLLAALADLLWAPLEIAGRQRVLIVADGPLANLPWAALPVDGEPLIERHLLSMAPSVRHHLSACSSHTKSRAAEIFVGAAGGLELSAEEYAPLAEGSRWTATVHNPCTRSDWPREAEAAVWHFSGHARYRIDNPFYSYLELADGPLFAADFRLRRNVVDLVVLAACRTGVYSLLPGDESTGLIRSLLEMGARNVLASHWAVADQSTSFWMQQFYRSLAAGSTPGASVREAARVARERYSSAYDWAGFSLFGAG